MIRILAAAAVCALMAQATFRSGTDAVTVDVSVRDGARVVTGLRAADFEVLDNGVPQDVAAVSRSEERRVGKERRARWGREQYDAEGTGAAAGDCGGTE